MCRQVYVLGLPAAVQQGLRGAAGSPSRALRGARGGPAARPRAGTAACRPGRTGRWPAARRRGTALRAQALHGDHRPARAAPGNKALDTQGQARNAHCSPRPVRHRRAGPACRQRARRRTRAACWVGQARAWRHVAVRPDDRRAQARQVARRRGLGAAAQQSRAGTDHFSTSAR